MKKTIKLGKLAGEFGENKDIAKQVRIRELMPNLSKGNEIVIDFSGMTGATQSFIHALISDPIRQFNDRAFDAISYKNTNSDIREIISIVYRYMQESIYGDQLDD